MLKMLFTADMEKTVMFAYVKVHVFGGFSLIEKNNNIEVFAFHLYSLQVFVGATGTTFAAKEKYKRGTGTFSRRRRCLQKVKHNSDPGHFSLTRSTCDTTNQNTSALLLSDCADRGSLEFFFLPHA